MLFLPPNQQRQSTEGTGRVSALITDSQALPSNQFKAMLPRTKPHNTQQLQC